MRRAIEESKVTQQGMLETVERGCHFIQDSQWGAKCPIIDTPEKNEAHSECKEIVWIQGQHKNINTTPG